MLRATGDAGRCRTVAETLLAHARRQANPAFEAWAERELSHFARLAGELEAADDLAHHALARSARLGMLPDLAEHLTAVAGVAAAEESWEEATRLFAAAGALADRLFVAPSTIKPTSATSSPSSASPSERSSPPWPPAA